MPASIPTLANLKKLILRVYMVAAILRCRLVRKDLVETHVVAIDAIARRTANDQIVWIAQVTDQRRHSDVDNVVAEAPPVGPTARNEPTILERILNVALEHIAAEDAQTRKPGVVGIVGIARAASGKAHLGGRQIDLDEIGNKDPGDVRAISFRSDRRIENKQINQT